MARCVPDADRAADVVLRDASEEHEAGRKVGLSTNHVVPSGAVANCVHTPRCMTSSFTYRREASIRSTPVVVSPAVMVIKTNFAPAASR
jgi:hypothetical protein